MIVLRQGTCSIKNPDSELDGFCFIGCMDPDPERPEWPQKRKKKIWQRILLSIYEP
jgi:hypothetical protein